MRNLVLLSLLVLVLFSCKKEKSSQVNPSKKTYKVTFNVSDFTQTISSATKVRVNTLKTDATTTDVGLYATVINYTVFDSNGNLVNTTSQSASATNFGLISDYLPAGTYTVVIDAGQNALTVGIGDLNLPANTLNNTVLDYYDSNIYESNTRRDQGSWSDTFLKKFQITVTDGDVNQTVNLDRIVGEMEVDFQDVIPTSAKSLSVAVNKEDFRYNFGSGTPTTIDTSTTYYTIPDSVKNTSNYKIAQIVLNTTSSFTVTLTAYNTTDAVIAQHVITNVTCQQNKRTILTGNFANISNNGFNINLNTEWGSTIPVNF